MGSVNSNARVALPTAPAAADPAPAPADGERGWDLVDGLTAMGNSVGSTLTDIATVAGAETDDEGNLRAGIDPLGVGGFAAVTAGPTALMAMRNRIDPLTGVGQGSFGDRFGAQAVGNGIRITPTLVSAIAGPAIADGITMIAPNLVKKYRDTKDIKDAALKKEAEKDNQTAKISRAVAGGVAVGVLAGAVFLLKPDLFKKFGVGVTHAIEGSTQFAVNGKVTKLSGVLNEGMIRSTMAGLGRPLLDSDAINIVKTIAPMAKDAAFTNRILLGTAGGIGTLLLANQAAGEEDPGRQKLMWGLTAAAGAATIGGAWGIGKLTQHSIATNSTGIGGMLAKNDLLMKPNIEWIKKYATTIAPITAVPAGTAASQYFNIVNDFDDITDARSPFRK